MRKRKAAEIADNSPVEALVGEICDDLDAIDSGDIEQNLADIKNKLEKSGVSALSEEEQEQLLALTSEDSVSSRLLTGPKKTLSRPITPRDIANLRTRAFNVVSRHIASADQVLRGQKAWSNQQVRVFGILVNKVLPDLHHTLTEINDRTKDLRSLSREELERIAADEEHDKKLSTPVDESTKV